MSGTLTDMTLRGRTVITGQLTAPAGSIRNAEIAAGAAISASKLQHRHQVGTNFGLAIGGSVTDREEVVFIARQAGTIIAFRARLATAATTGTTSFDLKVNGTTRLTGTIDITDAEGTTLQSGTIDNGSLSPGDVVSIEMDNDSGDGEGPFADVEIDQSA